MSEGMHLGWSTRQGDRSTRRRRSIDTWPGWSTAMPTSRRPCGFFVGVRGTGMSGSCISRGSTCAGPSSTVDYPARGFGTPTLPAATCPGIWLDRADLEDADLREANLQGARLTGANLRKATCRVPTCAEPTCAAPICRRLRWRVLTSTRSVLTLRPFGPKDSKEAERRTRVVAQPGSRAKLGLDQLPRLVDRLLRPQFGHGSSGTAAGRAASARCQLALPRWRHRPARTPSRRCRESGRLRLSSWVRPRRTPRSAIACDGRPCRRRSA